MATAARTRASAPTAPLPTAPIARARTRAMLPEAPAAAGHNRVTKTMRENAVEQYLQGKASNTAKSASDRKRKALYAEMKKDDVTEFEHTFKQGEDKVILDVKISQPEGVAMDPAKLYREMGCAKDPAALTKFLAIVSLAKGTVVEHFGEAMATRIEISTKGEENVKVSARK